MRTTYLYTTIFAFNLTLSVSAETKNEPDKTNFYGYLSVNYQDLGSIKIPSQVDSISVIKQNSTSNWKNSNFHLLFQSPIGNNFKAFGHLSADNNEKVELRNYWGEFALNEKFKFSAGKIYRPFGLFNETLDSSPTYIGISPPEELNENHLLVPRTTTLLFHGTGNLERNNFRYSISFDSGEQSDGTFLAYGWDVSNEFYGIFKTGYSFYRTNEKKGSSLKVGEGAPKGSVPTWMEKEKFFVWGGYVQADYWNFTVQASWWKANHKGKRDKEQLKNLDTEAALNPFQEVRFFAKNLATGEIPTTYNLDAKYKVRTWFTKIYYTWETKKLGQFIPYYNYEYYENPETISETKFGGDNFAGNSDDGKVNKHTFGVSYKPNSKVSFKLDSSTTIYNLDVKKQHYETFRMEIAYGF
ncbi:hypothetical protein IT568_01245 [bacterium]|nr:hypothetical protein [bacterium]